MDAALAIITDIHFGSSAKWSRGDADSLRALQHALQYLQREVRPRAVAVLGDFIEDPAAADALERLRALREAFDGLDCPLLALPGNHDPAADVFYGVFDPLPDWLDLRGGLRVTALEDEPQPGHHALRTAASFARLERAAAGFRGTVVALQHVPVLPPGATACPYTYVNLPDVLAGVRRLRVKLCLGGHYHAGTERVEEGGVGYAALPAFFLPGHPVAVLTKIDGVLRIELVQTEREEACR